MIYSLKHLPVPESIQPFCVDISILTKEEPDTEICIPFYAEGFPGIVYSKSQYPFYQKPQRKELSHFYLYGQTIEPMALTIKGTFRLICFRLYPFSIPILLDIDPQALTDDCYDLRKTKNIDTIALLKSLGTVYDYNRIVKIITDYFNTLLRNASRNPDYRVKLATTIILKTKGVVSIKEIRDTLNVSERTLERQFLKEIGVTPKQFAKIIQFNRALHKMTDTDFANLTQVSYDSGFSDQSHFIRSFKRYTGKTPKEFLKDILR